MAKEQENLEDLDLLKYNDPQTEEEWQEGYEAFMAKYPDIPVSQNIECLDLFLKREYAEAIVNGTKKVEFRDASSHYEARLIDKNVFKYIDKKIEEGDFVFMSLYDLYITPVRQVEKIHFHNYNNSWYLDVSVDVNQLVVANQDGVDMMHEEYDCDELDEDMRLAEENETEYPEYFFFAIDEILDTNLK